MVQIFTVCGWMQVRLEKNAVPGQFVSLYSRNGGKLLPRPISLCEIDKAEGKLRLVYRVTGKGTGTEEFSRLHAGVPIETMGPLGNGFPLDAVKGQKKCFSWVEESESRQCWKLLNSWTQKRSWFSDTEMSCFK